MSEQERAIQKVQAIDLTQFSAEALAWDTPELVYRAILVGLEGYDDEDTQRPTYVLTALAEAWVVTGRSEAETIRDTAVFDGITVRELRAFAERKVAEL